MKALQIYTIDQTSVDEVAAGMRLHSDEARDMVVAVGESRPALVMFAGTTPIIACGFVPLSPLSGSAYAWMQWTPEIYDHHLATTRACIEVFGAMLKHYNHIYGRCSYGSRPIRLLQRIGAKFHNDATGVPCYVIEARNEHAV